MSPSDPIIAGMFDVLSNGRLVQKDMSQFKRADFEDLLKRRFYYTPAFGIYGGVAGLYDYGPPGCAVMNNMVQLWRNFFVLEEGMLEVDCTCLTPEDVLKTSGHVARFHDLMSKDVVTGDVYRVDHLVKGFIQEKLKDAKISAELKKDMEHTLDQLDNLTEQQFADLLVRYDVRTPSTGNALTRPEPFNLMFDTPIGPTGTIKGYLRPETAQGMFVNFRRLLDYNNGKMPFAAAQIGRAFRNEISPRAGLLRVREFTMAEIEHFVDPLNKHHPRFKEISHLKLRLFSAPDQLAGVHDIPEVSLRDAVKSGLINNETLGYFLGRVYLYLVRLGIQTSKLRFRQHAPNEMAHYACDCWDAEILTSYGWIECVGCADRACYDLTCHSKRTNVSLVAREDLIEPIVMDCLQLTLNKGLIGKAYRQEAKALMSHLEAMSEDQKQSLQQQFEKSDTVSVTLDNVAFSLTKEMIAFERVTKKVHVREYTPSVIEPSFGLGRIMYSLLEHSYWVRPGDEQRAILSLPANIAPTKVCLLPLSKDPAFETYLQTIATQLRRSDVAFKTDDSSGTIGRRYSRADEVGIPFGITVDFDTLKTNSVTIRERDSMKQIRVPVDDIGALIRDAVDGKQTWEEIMLRYPLFLQQENTE